MLRVHHVQVKKRAHDGRWVEGEVNVPRSHGWAENMVLMFLVHTNSLTGIPWLP